jgi:hypothetical protein
MPSTIVCDILSCKNVARGSIEVNESDKHSFVVVGREENEWSGTIVGGIAGILEVFKLQLQNLLKLRMTATYADTH